MVRNPMAYDLPPSMRPNEPKSNKRPSIEVAIKASGVDVKALLELSKSHPEVVVNIRNQIDDFLENGATQKDITDFFRNQAESSMTVARVVESGPEWKQALSKLRKDLPRVN